MYSKLCTHTLKEKVYLTIIGGKCVCFLQRLKFIKTNNHFYSTHAHKREKDKITRTKKSRTIQKSSFHSYLIITGITYNNMFYLQIFITFFFYNKEGSLEDFKLFHCAPWMIPSCLLVCLRHCHSKILTLEL